MINILVVDSDDNVCANMIEMLNTYAEQNSIQVSVFQATNGSEAIMMCYLENCEIIFLNTLLPEMDSVDAIYKIRENNPNALIVGVLNDRNEFRDKVTRYGAEDYLAKPLDVDILKIRMDIYVSLIQSRRTHIAHSDGYNLYKEDVFARTISFKIQNRDALVEFWEYYLLDENKDGVVLSDLVRVLFRFAETLYKAKVFPTIHVEESETYLYFTMEKISHLSSAYIEIVLANNPNLTEYKIDHDKISIKCLIDEKNIVQNYHINQDQPSVNELSKHNNEEKEILNITDENLQRSELICLDNGNKIFNYMDQEQLEDTKEYISRLRSLLLIAGNGDIEIDEIHEIAYYLKSITKTISTYAESYAISRALYELAETVSTHVDEFMEKSQSMGKFYASFGSDLTQWVQMTFYEGAPSVDFMDDTIISNAMMLGSMLNTTAQNTQVSQNDFDDIFDF